MELKTAFIIKIWDYNGNPITDTITRLMYKYTEVDDDECEITVVSADKAVCDYDIYKEGKSLTAQWGWVNGVMSNIRKIYIWDREPDYDESGKIVLKLVCHERFAIAKVDSVATKNLSQVSVGTPLVFSSNAISNMILSVEKGNKELASLLTTNNIDLKSNKTYGDNYKVVSVYNGNKSTYQTLRGLLDRLPGGPYVIDSRDDAVVIRTRDFSKPSLRTYTWRGGSGELKKFKPITKNRSKKSQSDQVTVTTYDPYTKTATNASANGSTDKRATLPHTNSLHLEIPNSIRPEDVSQFNEIKNGTDFNIKLKNGKILTSKELAAMSKSEKIKQAKIISNNIDNLAAQGAGGYRLLQEIVKNKDKVGANPNPYNDYNKKEVDRGVTVEFAKGFFDDTTTLRKVAIRSTQSRFNLTNGVTRRDATITPLLNNYALVSSQIIPGSSLMSNDSPDKAAALANNLREDNKLKSNPAEADILGQPEIECGQIIYIDGVAKIHIGNYYVAESTHTVTDTSYDLSCKLTRGGLNNFKLGQKKGKVDLASLIPNNPNLKRKINTTKGPEGSIPTSKSISGKTPDKS